MTVSRVINGKQVVKPATRERVESAIAALNYSPSAAARSLAGGEETRIGLLYGNPSAAFLSEFLVGSLDQATRSGAALVIEKWDAQAPVAAVVQHLRRSQIAGVILPPPLCDLEALVEALTAADIVAVAVATGRTLPGVSVVGIDDRAAARTMTRHLIGLGHRRIGFIAGSPNLNASGQRREGYFAALEEAGIAPDAALIAQGDFTYRSGLDAAEQILDLPDPPSAIFASNDDMAAAAVAVAHRRGLAVPEDVTVCGFDDTALAVTIWPELTTIRQPIKAMTEAAVELLVREIRDRRDGAPGREPPAQLLLDYRLIRRQSDGPPSHAAP